MGNKVTRKVITDKNNDNKDQKAVLEDGIEGQKPKPNIDGNQSVNDRMKSNEMTASKNQPNEQNIPEDLLNGRNTSDEEKLSLGRSISLSALQNLKKNDRRRIIRKMPSQSSRKSIISSNSLTLVNQATMNVRKANRKENPVSSQYREIIQSCFENSHAEIGNRIFMRVYEKRIDFQKFINSYGKSRMANLGAEIRNLLENIIANLQDFEAVGLMARKYGERHVELKPFGFKPDFWVSIADAIITEGVILDMASHQPSETVNAWSKLITAIFSEIRDGYYAALRQQRRTSRRMSLRSKNTTDSDCSTTETFGELQIMMNDGERRPNRLMTSNGISSSSLPISVYGTLNRSPLLLTPTSSRGEKDLHGKEEEESATHNEQSSLREALNEISSELL